MSLSLEILWIRLFSFVNHSLPQAFAFVLVFYLIGIAVGAHIGKQFCGAKYNLWLVSGVVLLLSGMADLLTPFMYVYLSQTSAQLIVGAYVIFLTAALKAIVFPIAHHLGTLQVVKNIGRSVSRVYVSNIMGATLGPLFMGFIFLGMFTTQQCFIICAALTAMIATFCLMMNVRPLVLAANALVMLIMLSVAAILNPHWLAVNAADQKPGRIRQLVENQYGIVTVYDGGKTGDVVFGGNVYDGRTNLNPVIDSNGISRVIMLYALLDHPKHVLIIGMSIGSWLKVVTGYPGVETIDVVEINSGYLKAIDHYLEQKTALLDPRVNVYIDDGRRWLKSHPDKRYDLIVMNTTYHWRAYTANLLSREYLTLVKQHMNPGAVLAYNTTDSPDAFKTAHAVFDHAYLYTNFAIVADFDWRKKLASPEAAKKMVEVTLDGQSIFPPGSDERIQEILQVRTIALEEVEPFFDSIGRKLEIVTDRNIITEYKFGRTLKEPY